MKILFISPYNTHGGAERVITTLLNKFSLEHEVAFVTFDKDSNFYPIEKNVKKFRMGLTYDRSSKMKLFYISALEFKRLVRFHRILKEFKPNCVISFLFVPNILSIIACKQLNIPIIISERNDPSKYSKLKRMFMNLFYSYADGIVCQSDFVKTMAIKDYKIKNCSVIPNPINTSQFTNFTDENKVNKIISVGRLVDQKNHLMTIEAFAKICNKYPNYQLFIYGEGPLRSSLEKKIEELKLSDRVFLPGVDNEVMKKNQNAMLFIMSSKFEGFPNALVEAMANGVLSITTDFASGSARDIISNGNNGFIIPTGDLNALVKLMDKILLEPEKYKDVANAGRNIKNLYDLDSVKKQWDKIISEVVIKG